VKAHDGQNGRNAFIPDLNVFSVTSVRHFRLNVRLKNSQPRNVLFKRFRNQTIRPSLVGALLYVPKAVFDLTNPKPISDAEFSDSANPSIQCANQKPVSVVNPRGFTTEMGSDISIQT